MAIAVDLLEPLRNSTLRWGTTLNRRVLRVDENLLEFQVRQEAGYCFVKVTYLPTGANVQAAVRGNLKKAKKRAVYLLFALAKVPSESEKRVIPAIAIGGAANIQSYLEAL